MQLGRDAVVAALEPLLAELDEVVEGVTAFRRRERWQQHAAELHGDVAAVSDLERPPHRLLVAGEVERHLRRRLEEELVRIELPVVGVAQRVARLDAEKRLVGARVLGEQVVDVAGGDKRQPALLGDAGKEWVDARLDVQAGVLHLHVDVARAEDLGQPVELGLGVLRPAFLESLADPSREATGERDQPVCVAFEQLPVDARLVVVALQVAARRELDQVRIALVRLGEQRQVRVALGLRAAVVGDVDLAAEDRLDALLAGLAIELDRAGERPVVGERDRRHVELRRPRSECRDAAGAVQDGVLRVDVQVDERCAGVGHGTPTIAAA